MFPTSFKFVLASSSKKKRNVYKSRVVFVSNVTDDERCVFCEKKKVKMHKISFG